MNAPICVIMCMIMFPIIILAVILKFYEIIKASIKIKSQTTVDRLIKRL